MFLESLESRTLLAGPVITLILTNSNVDEKGGTAQLYAAASTTSTSDTIITLAISGTANRGSQYTIDDTKLTIPANTSFSNTANIAGVDDMTFDPNATVIFKVAGINSTDGATWDGNSQTATIVNQDPQPTVGLTTSATSFSEAGGVATITATLSAASGYATTVNLAYSGQAQQGQDYSVSPAGPITIPIGQTVATTTLTGLDDNKYGTDKAFSVSIASATNATPAGAALSETVTEADPMPTVTLTSNPSSFNESGGSAKVTVALSAASSLATTVNLSFAGTAVQGTNYTVNTQSVTIPAGQVSQPVTITGRDDNAITGPLSLTVTASSATNASIANGPAVTLTENDTTQPPGISAADTTVTDTTPDATFVVRLDRAVNSSTSVDYFTQSGTGTNGAIDGVDFKGVSGTLTFAPGQTALTVAVPILDDKSYKPTKSFTLNLINPVHGVVTDPQATGTILNTATPPAVSVGDGSAVEGNSGTTPLTVTISLSAPSEIAATVNLSTADNTAVAGVDYIAYNGSVTFNPGQVTQTVTLQVIGNTKPQPDRTFFLNATSSTNASIAKSQGVETIHDDDPAVGVSISNATVAAGSSPTTATFTVTLAQASGQTASVNYATGDGTAKAGTDYTATSGTLTFAPNVTSQTITVPISATSVPGPTKQFSVTLSMPVNTTISNSQGTGTITNSIAAPFLSIGDVTVAGSATQSTNATFNVILSAPSGQTVTVNYNTANVTALAGTDYGAVSGQLAFAPGQTVLPITVPILPNTAIEPSLVFSVNLSGATNATISDTQALGTILPRNIPYNVTINDVSTPHGPAGAMPDATFTVTLSSVASQPVTVQYMTADGSAIAGQDYIATQGSVTFQPGQTSLPVSVPLIGTNLDEPVKTFSLMLTGVTSNATIAIPKGTGTILNDSTTPDLSVNSVGVVDSTPSAIFTITLSSPSAKTVTVNYSTTDGSAVAGQDYTATSGTLSFAPGETAKQVSVPLIKDPQYTTTARTFTLNLTNPLNSTILSGTGTASITSTAAEPSVTIDDFSRTKSTSGTVLASTVVHLSAPSAVTTTVFYSTSDITAIAGTDYVQTMGSVTFAPGQTAAIINVPILGSTTPEGTRTFAVNLVMATNATIADAQAIGTILDPNAPAGIISDNPTITQAATPQPITFTIHLAEASALPITVNYATANLTAQAGTDYLQTSGVLTFNPGETVKTVQVEVLGSSVPQPAKQFALVLSNPVNSTIETTQGIGTILNGIANPAISIDDVKVEQSATATVNAMFHVTLSNASTLPITVGYSTRDGDAIAGTDYQSTSGTITFNPGQTVQTISVPVLPNINPQITKTFLVVLNAPTNATIADTMATGTIVNDNLARSLTVDDVQVANGPAGTQTSATFTVVLSSPSAQPVTVQFATADGTAKAGTDYLAVGGLLTFNPGQTSMTVTVPVLGSSQNKANLSFTLNLSAPQNATLSRTSATGTIVSGVTVPQLSVVGTTVEDVSPAATFVISLAAPSGQTITVNYSTFDGTAVAGKDYTATTGTLTFNPGDTSKTVSVPVLRESTYGPPTRSFTLVLSNPINAAIFSGTGTGTILDTVTPPTVTIDNFSVTEGNSGQTLATTTVHLSAASQLAATVSYSTADVSAIAGTDYVATAGLVTFAPGQTSATISIPIIGNTIPQPNRTFVVNLTNPTGSTLGNSQAVGTIVDDDPASGLFADNISVQQSTTPTTATFTIKLAQASGFPISVQYATANGTAIAGTDYLPTQGTLTFAPGETSKTVTVNVLAATVPKSPTTFSLLLTNPVNTTITTPTVTATIVNVVTNPSLAIAPVSVDAPTTGTAIALFNVTLSAPSGQTVTVNYQTSNGTAFAGTDYVAAQGTLTFAPGQTIQQIPVTVNGTMQLLPNRTFTVTLSGASDATIGTASATGTIVNSNLPHVATVSDASASTPPVGTTANEAFTVTLSNASDLTVTLQYATADITAKAGVDYVNTTGSLTFAPGQTTQTINVPILGQSVNKPNLTFALNLTSPQNATIGRAQGIGTIVSSVAEPSATIAGSNVDDTATSAPFTVTLSAASGQTITINYTTQDGTAVAGTNYTAASGTLTFAPGSRARPSTSRS